MKKSTQPLVIGLALPFRNFRQFVPFFRRGTDSDYAVPVGKEKHTEPHVSLSSLCIVGIDTTALDTSANDRAVPMQSIVQCQYKLDAC